MIDIHNHILFGIDDGASSIEESIKMIKEAITLGYKKFILTPHYIEHTMFNSEYEKNNEILNELKAELKNQNIDVNVYLGNEIMYSEEIVELIKQKHISKLNNSRYILIEIPRMSYVPFFKNFVYELILEGIIPIIAHPERCLYFIENLDLVKNLIEMGALTQVNMGSLNGKYGKKSEKIAQYLIKNNLCHFLASDSHKTYSENDLKVTKKFVKKIGREALINKLLIENPQKVINDEYI